MQRRSAGVSSLAAELNKRTSLPYGVKGWCLAMWGALFLKLKQISLRKLSGSAKSTDMAFMSGVLRHRYHDLSVVA
jgi:hypothetical protein